MSSSPTTRGRAPTSAQLRFIVSFTDHRASLAFVSAHPLDRFVAEQHVMWASRARTEAYRCSKYGFHDAGLAETSSQSSSSSSDSDNEDDRDKISSDHAMMTTQAPPRVRASAHTSSAVRHPTLCASSTDWLSRRTEYVNHVTPRCGVHIGDHVIALLPATSPPTSSALSSSRGAGVFGGAQPTVRAGPLLDVDDDDDHDDGDRSREIMELDEALWGPAVDITGLDSAWQLLQPTGRRHSRDERNNGDCGDGGVSAVERPLPSRLLTAAHVRVVYWEPRVMQSETTPADSPSLQWSMWWLCRRCGGAAHSAASAAVPEPVATATTTTSLSSAPSAQRVTASSSSSAPQLPFVLHARSVTMTSLRAAFALSMHAAPPATGVVRLSQCLAGLYVRLAASVEWLRLVDIMNERQTAVHDVTPESIAELESAGGLVNPAVAVMEAVLGVPPSSSCAALGLNGPVDITTAAAASQLERVVVMLPGREQSFLVRWQDYLRRRHLHEHVHAQVPSALTTSSVPSTSILSNPPLRALREFDGADCFLTDVNALGALPHLEVLLLANNRQLRDDGVCGLAQQSRSLRLVDLSGCVRVGDVGAVAVAAIPTLEILSLMHTAITEVCVPLLAARASRRLRRLAVDQCTRLRGADVLARALPALERLSAQRCGAVGLESESPSVDAQTDAEGSDRSVQARGTLQHISVQGTGSLTDARPWLFGFPNLEHLNLSFTAIDETTFAPPPRRVSHNDNNDDDGDAEETAREHEDHDRTPARNASPPPPRSSLALQYYPRFLHTLSVEGCPNLTELGALGQLPSLRILRAGQTSVTSAGLRGLERCRRLEDVDLRLCFDLESITPLQKLPSLRVLNLFACVALRDAGLAPIATSTTLRQLYLMGCHGLRDVGFLSDIRSLRRLFLRDTHITETTVRALACGLSGGRAHPHTAYPSSSSPPPLLWSSPLRQLDVGECGDLNSWPDVCTRGFEQLVHLNAESTEWETVPAHGLGHRIRTCTVSGNRLLTELLPCLLATPSLRDFRAGSLPLTADALSARHCSDATTTEAVPSRPHRHRRNCCHSLRTLDLTHCETLRDVDGLAYLPQLAALTLHSTAVTDDALAQFTGLTTTTTEKTTASRRTACRTCRRRHGKRHADQAQHRPLRALSLQQCRGIFSVAALTAASCPHLHTLVLSESNAQDSGLLALAACHELIVLKLDGCKGVSDLAPLAQLRKLEEVHANGTNVTTAGLAGLVHGLSLEKTKGENVVPVGDAMTLPEPSQPRLAVDRATPDAGVTAAKSDAHDSDSRSHTLPSTVRFLSVCGCPMIFSGFADLAYLPLLRILNISNCRNLRAAHFRELRDLQSSACGSSQQKLFPKLEVLDVSRCVLLEGSLEGIEVMQNLREVNTAGTPLAELDMPLRRRLLLMDGAL